MAREEEMEADKDNLVEEDLLEILEAAIQEEKASQDRYLGALNQARSQESRALFQELLGTSVGTRGSWKNGTARSRRSWRSRSSANGVGG